MEQKWITDRAELKCALSQNIPTPIPRQIGPVPCRFPEQKKKKQNQKRFTPLTHLVGWFRGEVSLKFELRVETSKYNKETKEKIKKKFKQKATINKEQKETQEIYICIYTKSKFKYLYTIFEN